MFRQGHYKCMAVPEWNPQHRLAFLYFKTRQWFEVGAVTAKHEDVALCVRN